MHIKNLIIVITLLMATVVRAQESSSCCEEAAYFEIQASAEKRVVPDVAYLALNIRETDEKRNPINMAQVEGQLLSILDRLNIPRDQLKVSGLSGIQQKINRRKIGHIQSKSYTLKLTDFSTIDDLLDDLDKLKVVDIHLQKLDNTKMDEHKIDAYAEAMKMAKRKADAALGAIGQSVDGVIYVLDQPQVQYPSYRDNISNMAFANEAMPGGIENNVGLDDILVRQELTVRFKVK